jgi:Flp pilus assembly protein TadB
MKRESTSGLPEVDALARVFDVLQQEALQRDDRARAKEREEREEQIRRAAESEAAAKQELSRWLLRERFGLVVIGIGVAFGILLTFLPTAPGKFALYGCALVCVLLGARQKDQAQKRIAQILPRLSVDDLVALRAKRW